MNSKIQEILKIQTNSTKIRNIELIQTLWSGYGELSRVTLDNKSVIIKLIRFPATSHKRKVKSYQVEMNWYKNYNSHIDKAYTPKFIASGEVEDYQYIILEDLGDKNFEIKKSITFKQVQLCLKWLASIHANYLGVSQKDLWNIGTYWHLDTRPDEFNQMKDLELKKAAKLIDQRLNKALYQTIIHGDAKLANFLISESKACAVDFQYVGGGSGIKDVAYFLSSIYNEDELFENETKCLDYYFQELNKLVKNLEIEKEWRDLYPFAWADFYRFLNGWSPDHYKINTYSKHMRDKVLKCI
jgi:hypothetical protein